ncbi:MAG TPA: SAM-dependent methyltransferase [Burkholderiaceae bacterium]|nr:SAM-dependent methyltransferase [Burkholderiaceae bacterium]
MVAYTTSVTTTSTMPDNGLPAAEAADPLAEFIALADAALAAHPAVRLVLAKPRRDDDNDAPQRVTVRALTLKGEPHWSFVYTHATRDVTKNLPTQPRIAGGSEPAPLRELRTLLESRFLHAHLIEPRGETQLLTSKRGKRTLLRGKLSEAPPPAADEAARHDRLKHRYVAIERPFLIELGVTTPEHQLVPAMARKWKQINKFVEVLDHALAATGLAQRERIEVLDFGAGKGYLTFAMHEHLRHTRGLPARVTGVELREDLVALCNGVIGRLGLEGLHFEHGDVGSHAAEAVDIMVALHACDTATDHAIHKGVRAGAAIILCSPCCHKELRPQLLSPHPLRPILKHGVHLGQEAEMLTDSLRALLLDACGYDTQVFEFVSLEHTNKNKMILAVKRGSGAPHEADALWQQVRDVKAFYGIRDQCLETLLLADRGARPSPQPSPHGGRGV